MVEDFKTNQSSIMCLFVSYKSMNHLKEAKDVAEKIKADTRVVVLESLELCSEAEEIECFANANQFETVFLKPNEEQKTDAEELAEKVGIERLIETITVCSWPWRVINVPPKPDESVNEQKIDEDDVLEGTAADFVMQHYVRWFQSNAEPRFPSPQHAERVHLSPDSPTTTEGTTNLDDVSISVDIDLVCMKNLGDTEQSRFDTNSDKAKRNDRTASMKKTKK